MTRIRIDHLFQTKVNRKMATALPKIHRDLWYRAGRMGIKHPGALNLEGVTDDVDGINRLIHREMNLECLIFKANADKAYIERR